MEEIIFRPRYSWARIIYIFMLMLFTILNIVLGVDRLLDAKKMDWLLMMSLFVLGFLGLYLFLKVIPKKIIFNNIKQIRFRDVMIVEYRFRPPVVIEYKNITSMDMPLWLKAGDYRLGFTDYENQEEIRSIFLQLRKNGLITKNQYS